MKAHGHDLFAITAHGLAALCAAELAAIGVTGRVETGGVAWRGTAPSMYRANLELRTASRIIARVGTFRARGFAELERRAARLPWQDFLRQATPVVLRVTCRKSKLYHEGAVGERVARVLADTAGVAVVRRGSDDDEADGAYDAPGAPDAGAPSAGQQGATSAPGAQLVIIRFMRDECTISVDSSGALLHQRGYRRAVAKAPLRETMAAALLLAAGWRGDTPLLDPLCGSGTIPIEAALLAGGIAPGIARADLTPRAFAFEAWPDFDRATYSEIVRSARAAVRPVRTAIVGADRNAGAIAAARANAARAGVLTDLEFKRASLVDLAPMPGSGHVVTNPPYGVRVGDRRELRALYALLGSTISARLPGWSVTMLAADDTLAAATRLPLIEQLATRNGGIPVRLLSTAGTGAAGPVYQPPHSDEENS